MSRWMLAAVALTMGVGCGSSTVERASDDPLDPAKRPALIACGVLGGVEDGRIWGWAQIVDQPPAVVRIEIDGIDVGETIAYEYREDLVEKGLHPTGAAGFSIDVYEETEEGLTPVEFGEGTQIQAYLDVIDLELTDSPKVVKDPVVTTPPTGGGGGGDKPLGWCQADSWTFYE